jgi:hypothetical protein
MPDEQRTLQPLGRWWRPARANKTLVARPAREPDCLTTALLLLARSSDAYSDRPRRCFGRLARVRRGRAGHPRLPRRSRSLLQIDPHAYAIRDRRWMEVCVRHAPRRPRLICVRSVEPHSRLRRSLHAQALAVWNETIRREPPPGEASALPPGLDASVALRSTSISRTMPLGRSEVFAEAAEWG